MSSVMTLKRYPSQGGMTFGKIGARKMMKTFYTARDYLYMPDLDFWDGIENVGWGEHSNSATSWKNLIGSAGDWNNLTFGLDYAILTQYDKFVVSSKPRTIEFVLAIMKDYWTVAREEDAGLFTSRFSDLPNVGTSNYGGIRVGNPTFNPNAVNIGTSSANSILGNMVYAAQWNQLVSLSIVLNTNGTSIYRNGAKVVDSAATYDASYQIGNINGLLNISYRGCPCHMSSIRTHSRALTADKIAANYAVDKARFNLL